MRGWRVLWVCMHVLYVPVLCAHENPQAQTGSEVTEMAGKMYTSFSGAYPRSLVMRLPGLLQLSRSGIGLNPKSLGKGWWRISTFNAELSKFCRCLVGPTVGMPLEMW